MTAPWSVPLALHTLSRGAQTLELTADEATRARIAKVLYVPALPAFSARVEVKPWLDGAEIRAVFDATVTQECGVSLELFDQAIHTVFEVRCVPAGSPNASVIEEGEIAIDPEADDPPDILEGEAIDLGAYLVEHLSLEIDPFPRKPDAVFEAFETGPAPSPFAVLSLLKRDGETEPSSS